MTPTAGRFATIRVAGLALALQLLLPLAAVAQVSEAWVPGEGEAFFSLSYQFFNLSGHFETDGTRTPGAIPSRSHVALAEFEYGLTDKLAFNVRLPFMSSGFTGGADPILDDLYRISGEVCALTPCPEELTSLDTGDYYSTFQDWGFAIRYNVLDKWLMVTPFLGLTVPSHDYRTVGEAAPGQNLRALHTGFSIGRLLDPVIPGAYIQAAYAYSFVQPARGVSLDRSNAQFEVGYKLLPTWYLRALGMFQQTHGGISWNEAYHRVFDQNDEIIIPVNTQDALLLLDHDRLLADRYWHVGGGTTVSLTNSLVLDAAVLTFVSGADSHYGAAGTVGLTWKFQTGSP